MNPLKIVAAPDSFKGSLSAPEAAAAMARGIRRACPDADVVCLPLADGGEGTADALVTATGGRLVSLTVTGPLGQPVNAAYGLLGPDGQTAVVEMAAAAGLGLVPEMQRDPRRTTTYGVGELLLAAANSGARELIVGLGGSATNDGGAGAMQALGVRFSDSAGRVLPDGMGGSALARVSHIDASGLRFPSGVTAIIASDVTNPLTGPSGASAVFGPQKGADAITAAELDAALSHYATLLRDALGQDVGGRPGAGAAGGLGAALMAFLGASVQSGINLVLDAAQFDARARGADWVFTGEGRIDSQTAQGKTISGVLARCRELGNMPVLAFGGAVDEAASAELAALGLTAAFPIVPGPMSLADAMQGGARLLEDAAARVTRLLVAGRLTAQPS